jgi:predicted small secreted protein
MTVRRRFLVLLVLFGSLTAASCNTNQGNGEAQPENTGKGYNADNEKNDQRNSKSVGTQTTPSKPAPGQTPSQPASKPTASH